MVLEKSFGFGFVQILGFATHWLLVAKVGGIRGSSWSSWCWKEQGKKLLISASANLQWVSVRHLLVKVIHRPKEELSQLTRQVAKASNWWLVQRPTLLWRKYHQKTIWTPKRFKHCIFSGFDCPTSARLEGRWRIAIEKVIASKSGLGMLWLLGGETTAKGDNSSSIWGRFYRILIRSLDMIND